MGVLPPNCTAAYEGYMAHLEAQLASRTDLKMHFLHLSVDGIDLKDWCVSHPNVAAHQAFANQLVTFLKGVKPEWAEPVSLKG